jgi:hypothetical protein
LVDVVGAALGDLQPASFDIAFGEVKFAANRRVKTDKGYAISVNPAGPVDHRVPVLRVTAPDGQVRALWFAYACHNTTLTGEFYQLSGDYAGFAQAALEKQFPGATALFYILCAADQNPEPRSKLELAQRHGEELAAEVARVARGPMEPVTGRIKTAFQITRLPLRNMKQVDYPVQAVRFGKNFTLLALGGEVVVDYSLLFQRMWPKDHVIVAGYSNDVMAYIPSLRVLKEGGYEGGDSMKWYGLDAPFADDVEERVKDAVTAVMKRVK